MIEVRKRLFGIGDDLDIRIANVEVVMHYIPENGVQVFIGIVGGINQLLENLVFGGQTFANNIGCF